MKAWLLALAILQGADAASTCTAFHRGGFHEANPVLPQTCAGVVGVKAATVGVLALAHIAAALYHRFLKRDVVMARMWPPF